MIPYLHRTGRKRKRVRKFKPGYDRTGGLYGRFRKRRKRNKTEQKFYDMTIGPLLIGTAGTAGTFIAQGGAGPEFNTKTIVDIPQGTGPSQRIGRKITITAIHLRMNFESTGTPEVDLEAATETNETIRIIMFLDKQCNGTAISATDLLLTDNYNSFRNINNTARFRHICDKTFTVNSAAIADTNASHINHKDKQLNISYKVSIPMEYSGTTGAITEIRSNNIGIIVWPKTGSRVLINETTVCRIRYTDK